MKFKVGDKIRPNFTGNNKDHAVIIGITQDNNYRLETYLDSKLINPNRLSPIRYIDKCCTLIEEVQLELTYRTGWKEFSPTYSRAGESLQVDASFSECSHKNKYINRAFVSKFWVCPDCKKDLGDA